MVDDISLLDLPSGRGSGEPPSDQPGVDDVPDEFEESTDNQKLTSPIPQGPPVPQAPRISDTLQPQNPQDHRLSATTTETQQDEAEADNVSPADSLLAASSKKQEEANRDMEEATSSKPLRKPSFWSRFRWGWESIAVLVDIAYIGALIGIYMTYHDKPLANWKSKLEPNTVAAILTTIAKFTCLYIVAEVVSQFKWIQARKAGPIRHLDTFDQGSRLNPFSAIKMAVQTRFTFVGTLSAVIIVASLAFEMTVQQAFNTNLKSVPATPILPLGVAQVPQNVTLNSLQASLGVAHHYKSSSCSDPNLPSYIIEAQSAIFNGIRDPAPMPFNCPFTSCSWAEIRTLAVCGSCQDVTASTVQAGLYYNFSKSPDDDVAIRIPMRGGIETFRIFGYSTIPKTVAMGSSSSSSGGFGTSECDPGGIQGAPAQLPKRSNYKYIAGFASVKAKGSGLEATRCQFHWCEQIQKDIRWTANSKSPSAASVSSTPLRRYLKEEMGDLARSNPSNLVHYTSRPEGADPSSITPDTVYEMDAEGEVNLARQIQDLFTAYAGGAQAYGSQPCALAEGLGAYLHFADLNVVTENTAISLTNAIRGKENLIPLTVQGMGYKDELCLYVRQGWFVPSVVIISLSVVLLMYMAFWEARSEKILFKSSILAFYFYGFEGNQGELRPLDLQSPSQLNPIAKRVHVCLKDSGGRETLCANR